MIENAVSRLLAICRRILDFLGVVLWIIACYGLAFWEGSTASAGLWGIIIVAALRYGLLATPAEKEKMNREEG